MKTLENDWLTDKSIDTSLWIGLNRTHCWRLNRTGLTLNRTTIGPASHSGPDRVISSFFVLQSPKFWVIKKNKDTHGKRKWDREKWGRLPRESKKSFHPLLLSMYWLKNKLIIHLLCTYDMYRSILGHPSLYINDSLNTVEHGLAQHVEASGSVLGIISFLFRHIFFPFFTNISQTNKERNL